MKILIDYFLYSLFIGVLIIYIKSPKPSIVIKSPVAGHSSGDIVYTDNSGSCFKYSKTEVMCPLDPTVKTVNYHDQ